MSVTEAGGGYTSVGSHVPESMAKELAQLAAASERSVSGEIRLAIKKHLAESRAQ